MQKYFIFGLLAILTACSSDKGGGLNDGWMNYRNTGVPTSNAGITSMTETDGLKLSDADFTLSNEEAGLGTNMKFAVSDNGIVTGIKFPDGTTDSDGNPNYKTAVRSGNTGFFRFSASDGGKNISMGTGYSAANEKQLQYSDFGRILFNGDNDQRIYATYTGGYKQKYIEKPTTGNMTFSGNAAGYVYGRDNSVLPVHGGAKLTFNDGNEQLVAEFERWYKSGEDAKAELKKWGTLTIDGNTATFVAGSDVVDKKYMFDTENPIAIDKFTTSYYGNNSEISEVVGSFGLHQDGTGENDAGVRLDAAFGGVK